MESKQIKLLDLTTLLPGPFTSYLLSRNNIKVTKIEDLKNSDPLRQMWPTQGGVSVSYQAINRGKEVVNVDFRQDRDLDKIRELIKNTDVIVENYKPGRMDKIGFGFEDCLKLNPKIVYCSIVGYPRNHPLYTSPAHDLNVLGLCGYLNFNNSFQVPALPLSDIFTSYEASLAILSALLNGGSKKLEISMLESILNASIFISSVENNLKRDIKAEEFALWGNFPCYSLYKTSDKKYMVLAALEPAFWSDFCNQTGLTELDNCQFDSKAKSKITEKIKTKTQKEWFEMKIECFTPVLTFWESKNLGYV